MLGNAGTVALVWSTNSQSWLFPKGHVDMGEGDEAAARREIAEETGLFDLEYLDDLGSFKRNSLDERADKTVRMFLFAAPSGSLLSPTLEIEKAEWFPLSQVSEVLGKGRNEVWFSADRAWFVSVFERVRQAVQRD